LGSAGKGALRNRHKMFCMGTDPQPLSLFIAHWCLSAFYFVVINDKIKKGKKEHRVKDKELGKERGDGKEKHKGKGKGKDKD